MRAWLVVFFVVAGCGFPRLSDLSDASDGTVDDGNPGDAPDAGDGRVEVARVPVTVNRDIDVLLVIDDSASMLDKQTNLKNAFPAFINELSVFEGGLPSVHIGVVTPDLGTKGALDSTSGPPIGSGPGSCVGDGKNGVLQTNGTNLVSGTFISDVRNTAGTRTTNYSGSLADAMSAIASVGAAGCGFEQHLEAAKRALNNNPPNAGFLRPNAGLAILVFGDEDDCSMARSTLMSNDEATLGPLQSFRCTRFGITCDSGGTTSDQMNAVGMKTQCHSNESSVYLTRIADYATFFKALKADPNDVLVAAIAAPQAPFQVELRTPAGGGTAIPALAHACTYAGATGTEVADPAVRIAQLASQFTRNTVSNICSVDLSTQLVDVARHVKGLAGDACLTKDIATPIDCVAFDEVGTTKTALARCDASVTTDCYQLVADATKCSTASQLRLEVMRSSAPPAETSTVIRCKL